MNKTKMSGQIIRRLGSKGWLIITLGRPTCQVRLPVPVTSDDTNAILLEAELGQNKRVQAKECYFLVYEEKVQIFLIIFFSWSLDDLHINKEKNIFLCADRA